MMNLRRILVVVDESMLSGQSLAAVAALAAARNAELAGLFIEDADVLEAAALSFTSAIDVSSGKPRPLQVAELHARFQKLANQAEKVFADLASKASLSWTFKSVRGSVSQEISLAALEADLVSLSKARHPLLYSRKLDTIAEIVLQKNNLPVFLLGKAVKKGAIAVVVDDAEASKVSLNLAIDLARAEKVDLYVLMPAVKAFLLYEELSAYVKHFPIHFRIVEALSEAALTRVCSENSINLLIVSQQTGSLTMLEKLNTSLDINVILVR